jgi:hypothetical protein
MPLKSVAVGRGLRTSAGIGFGVGTGVGVGEGVGVGGGGGGGGGGFGQAVRLNAAKHTPRAANPLRHLPAVAPVFIPQVWAMKAE